MLKEKQRAFNIFKTLGTEAKDHVWKNFVTGVAGEKTIQILSVTEEDEQKMCKPHNTNHLNFRRQNAKD